MLRKGFGITRGFTLIELLVVLGIIVVLASIIFLATDEARKKGKDASIKSNLQTIRTQAALFYVENNYSYLPPGGAGITPASGGNPNNTCPLIVDSSVNSMFEADPVIFSALQEALKYKAGNPGYRCANSATAWAVTIRLNTSTSSSWCVDSTGQSRQFAGNVGQVLANGTFICNTSL